MLAYNILFNEFNFDGTAYYIYIIHISIEYLQCKECNFHHKKTRLAQNRQVLIYYNN